MGVGGHPHFGQGGGRTTPILQKGVAGHPRLALGWFQPPQTGRSGGDRTTPKGLGGGSTTPKLQKGVVETTPRLANLGWLKTPHCFLIFFFF
jgi:hypothetical protein